MPRPRSLVLILKATSWYIFSDIEFPFQAVTTPARGQAQRLVVLTGGFVFCQYLQIDSLTITTNCLRWPPLHWSLWHHSRTSLHSVLWHKYITNGRYFKTISVSTVFHWYNIGSAYRYVKILYSYLAALIASASSALIFYNHISL